MIQSTTKNDCFLLCIWNKKYKNKLNLTRLKYIKHYKIHHKFYRKIQLHYDLLFDWRFIHCLC